MFEVDPPGKAVDCRERPQNEFLDPRCARLVLFLQGSDSYWEYKYYYCPHCERVWESSFFYQDWEPFWEVIEWERFKGMKEKWRSGGKDYCPQAEIAAGVRAFGEWALGLGAPIVVEY
jgi:hypothetical protein